MSSGLLPALLMVGVFSWCGAAWAQSPSPGSGWEQEESEAQAEEQTAEEPQAEEQTAEEPQAEEPQVEEPQAEEPQAEGPTTEQQSATSSPNSNAARPMCPCPEPPPPKCPPSKTGDRVLYLHATGGVGFIEVIGLESEGWGPAIRVSAGSAESSENELTSEIGFGVTAGLTSANVGGKDPLNLAYFGIEAYKIFPKWDHVAFRASASWGLFTTNRFSAKDPNAENDSNSKENETLPRSLGPAASFGLEVVLMAQEAGRITLGALPVVAVTPGKVLVAVPLQAGLSF